jgi:hypothetical protein
VFLSTNSCSCPRCYSYSACQRIAWSISRLLAQFMLFTLRRPVINQYSLLQPKRTYIRSKFLPPLSTLEEKHEPDPEPSPRPQRQNPPPPPRKLPYFVSRDAKGNLPVFCSLKNANTRKVTWLRGVEGDTEVRGRLPYFCPGTLFICPRTGSVQRIED